MADSRYLEAWKRNPLPPKAAVGASTASKGSSYQVRLDTPGGVTYSPDQLGSHNQTKRLFIPYVLGEGLTREDDDQNNEAGTRRDEYNFDDDLKGPSPSNESGKLAIPTPENGDDKRLSAAQAYAASIDMNAPSPTLSEAPTKARGKKTLFAIDDEINEYTPPGDSYEYEPSVSQKTTSGLSTMSTRSTKTVDLITSSSGELPPWYMRASARANVTPLTVPPSKTGKASDHKTPWAAMKWYGHRALERPSARENERGITAFEDVGGQGRVPRADEALDSDGKTIRAPSTTATAATSSKNLRVADVFVVDPRPQKPLRMVRRVDPRQVLVLASGTLLAPAQVASQRAALAARDAGVDLSTLSMQDQSKTQKMIAEQISSDAQGGIGVIFSPHDEPLAQDLEGLDVDPRAEVNLCRRLEAAPTFTPTSLRRAQLRAVLAAVELSQWEEEGFDKIVVGTDQEWIVRGIVYE